jgi:hypothetical protein
MERSWQKNSKVTSTKKGDERGKRKGETKTITLLGLKTWIKG